MNSYWNAGIVFTLACITGTSLVLAATSYSAYLSRTEALSATYGFRFPRVIKITAVDLQNRTITGESIDTGSSLAGPITFRVNERTRFEKKIPVIENGVLVGLSPAIPATPAELEPGSFVFARLVVEADRTITAYYLLLDDPLTVSF